MLNTLTIVCDTHRQEMVAAQEALEISERRIVIDHHRRAADFVENPCLHTWNQLHHLHLSLLQSLYNTQVVA